MGFGGQGPGKKRRLAWSMALLAGVVLVAGIGTKTVTDYFHSRDPIYQCIQDPLSQPYQLTVHISATEDGVPARIPSGVGITDKCTLPVHTLQENTIHVAYKEPYTFTLGHFLYNWIGQNLSKYDTKVYVNGNLHSSGGSFLDIPLKDGDSIRVEFTTRK
ncbi:MAG TPA: hypothetical protein VHA09_05615 [Nitrososphaera sp.]|nr:hypothetical protein [Nitrososphaera sp.]